LKKKLVNIFFVSSVASIFREVIIFSRTQQSGEKETISGVNVWLLLLLLLHEQNYLSRMSLNYIKQMQYLW
jgi:hypothetical protein